LHDAFFRPYTPKKHGYATGFRGNPSHNASCATRQMQVQALVDRGAALLGHSDLNTACCARLERLGRTVLDAKGEWARWPAAAPRWVAQG